MSVCLYVSAYVCMCMHVCVFMCVCKCMHLHSYVCVCKCVHVCVCIYVLHCTTKEKNTGKPNATCTKMKATDSKLIFLCSQFVQMNPFFNTNLKNQANGTLVSGSFAWRWEGHG